MNVSALAISSTPSCRVNYLALFIISFMMQPFNFHFPAIDQCFRISPKFKRDTVSIDEFRSRTMEVKYTKERDFFSPKNTKNQRYNKEHVLSESEWVIKRDQ